MQKHEEVEARQPAINLPKPGHNPAFSEVGSHLKIHIDSKFHRAT
jgi:hypothetical protein